MKVLIAAIAYAALFLAIEMFTRKAKINKELSRKAAHIIAGTSAAFLPLIVSFHEIMALSILFLPVMLLSKQKNFFSSIHQVKRRTLGEVYFPVSIFITAFLFPSKELYTYGVLVMSLSDGLASVFGQRFGQRKYVLWQGNKSYFGSAIFFVTTIVLGLIFFPRFILATLMAAIVLTLVEGALSGGIDNLVLPPLGAGLLLILPKLLLR